MPGHSCQCGTPLKICICSGLPTGLTKSVMCALPSEAHVPRPASQYFSSAISSVSRPEGFACPVPPLSSYRGHLFPHKLFALLTFNLSCFFLEDPTGTLNSERMSKRSRIHGKIVHSKTYFPTDKSAVVEQCNSSSAKQIVLNTPNGFS